jgi:uncharacterized membrane protein
MRAPLAYRNGSLRAFGHPLHVMLVHFPLGLWPLVFPLELAGFLGWETGWRIAFWANAAAVLAALPTAATGLADMLGLKRGPAAERTANLHMVAMLGAAALFGGELCFHPHGATNAAPGAAIPAPGAFVNLGMTLLGTAVLLWGAWLGGELVFRHGAGRIGEVPRDREGTEVGG